MKKTIVEKHFDKVSATYDLGKHKYAYYYSSLKNLLENLIGKNKYVLEFGCGTGDLLESLDPKKGYGFDISSEMIRRAKMKYGSHKNLHFFSRSQFTVRNSLDAIFMSDVIEHLDNPQETFNKISRLMNKNSKFILTMANPLWEPVLMFWEWGGWKMPEGPHYRIKNYELRIIIEKAGMKVVKHDYKLLIPIKIPLITDFVNKHLEKYLKPLAFIEYFVAVKV